MRQAKDFLSTYCSGAALTVALLLIFSTPLARAQDGNLESVMNAFLAIVAKDHVELQTEIKLINQGDDIPAGFQLGRSALMDDFTFRPKTWKELTPAEKQLVMKDPKLKSFLISMRGARLYPMPSGANVADSGRPGWYPMDGAPDQTVEMRAKITPEEMVKNRPVFIDVAPTAEKK